MRQLNHSRWHLTWLVPFAAVACGASTAVAQFEGPQPVVVIPVERRAITAEQSFVATIEPHRETIIGSAVEGRVIEVMAREGDFVAEGQPLVQLRTDTIKIALSAGEAELQLRRETLRELRNGLRPEEISQTEARMHAAEADRRYQEARAQRLRRLHETSRTIVTDEQIDEAEAKAEQALQTLLEATAAFEMAKKGPREERITQAEANVEFQHQQVLQLEDQLAKHTVRSPFDGFVSERHSEAGKWIKQGDPIASMVDLNIVDVTLELPERYVAGIRIGTPVTVTVEALSDELMSAAITRIVPQGKRQGRTFPVKIEMENRLDEQQQPKLKAGMLARVSIPVGTAFESLVVPKDALVLGGSSPTVMIVVPSGDDPNQLTVAPVPVKVGIASGNLVAVSGNVQSGDQVVIRGNERVRPGMPVVIQK